MITEFKLFEAHAYGKNNEKFFAGDLYIIFSDKEGKERSHKNGKIYPNYLEDKIKILNILKEYYDIGEYFEKRAMEENSWGWRIWFSNSFGKRYIDLNIISTTGWHIDETYNQITAKELLDIGIENIEAFLNAKKYNL
jgi:hypothetical protein